jgi:hypothetical protein
MNFLLNKMKITLDVKVSLLVYKDTSFPFNYGRIQTRSTSRSSSSGLGVLLRSVVNQELKTTHDACASWVVFDRNRICRISPLPYDFNLSCPQPTVRGQMPHILSRFIQQNCPLA